MHEISIRAITALTSPAETGDGVTSAEWRGGGLGGIDMAGKLCGAGIEIGMARGDWDLSLFRH